MARSYQSAMLQGLLHGMIRARICEQKFPMKVAKIEQTTDKHGNYERYFEIEFESGHRVRVEVTDV
jgi:hypothetical protein